MNGRHWEAAFDTVIEHHLLSNGYVAIDCDGFDRDGAPTAADRRHINSGVDEVLWVAALKPNAVRLGHNVKE
jgi:hypothetical protein